MTEPDDSYISVPPNRTFFVQTRYIYTGKGEPLPLELDEDAERSKLTRLGAVYSGGPPAHRPPSRPD
jgi:hypothetical protein